METKIGKWLNDKFLAWEREQGSRKTTTEFAEYLGVRQSTLSQWMNGKRAPTGENIPLLASKLGAEIYRLTGLISPDPLLGAIIEMWDEIPEDAKEKVLKQAEKYAAQNIKRGGKTKGLH